MTSGMDSSTEIRKPTHISVVLDNEQYQLPTGRTFLGRLRNQLREPLSEFLATCMMIVLQNGVVAQVVLSEYKKGEYLSISFGQAMGVMCAIYVGGGVSGAHMNPAVTFCMAIWRGFSWRKVPVYWLAQFLGAFTGGAIVFANYRKAFTAYSGEGVFIVTGTNATANVLANYPAPFMTPVGSFFSAVLGTCILLLVVLGQSDENNMYAAKNSPLVIAFTILSIGLSLTWETGYSINPAADFGPRCFSAAAGWGSEVFTAYDSYTWIAMIAPFVGSALAGLIYELFIDSDTNQSRLTYHTL